MKHQSIVREAVAEETRGRERHRQGTSGWPRNGNKRTRGERVVCACMFAVRSACEVHAHCTHSSKGKGKARARVENGAT